MSTSGGGAGGGDTVWTVVGSGGAAPPFTNGWTSAAATQFRKTSAGLVIVEYDILSAAGASLPDVFTFPVGYRPGIKLRGPAMTNGGVPATIGGFTITTAGVFSIFTPAGATPGGNCTTGPICFYADA